MKKLGYLVQFDPYKRAGTVDIIEKLGTARPVVVVLISELPEHSNIELYCDNLFFISPTLIDYLSNKGFNIIGTVHSNRTDGCPLIDIKSFKKRKTGNFGYKFYEKENNVILVRLNDKNVVTIA